MGNGTGLASFTLLWDGDYFGRGLGTEIAVVGCRALKSPSSPAWDHILVTHIAVAICSLQLLAD